MFSPEEMIGGERGKGKEARRESSRECLLSFGAFCMRERWLWMTKKIVICSWQIAQAPSLGQKLHLARKRAPGEKWEEGYDPLWRQGHETSAQSLKDVSLTSASSFRRCILHFWLDSHLQAKQAKAGHRCHSELLCVVLLGCFHLLFCLLSLNPLPLMQGHNLAVKTLCSRTCLGIKGPTKAL